MSSKHSARQLTDTRPKAIAQAVAELQHGDYLLIAATPGLRLAAGKVQRSWIHRYRRTDGRIAQVQGEWGHCRIAHPRPQGAPLRSVPKLPVSVLVVVYARIGEVLLMERRQPPGWWQSVTGSLEPGETPWDAAVRELHEETGLAADGLVDLGIGESLTIAPAWCHRFAPGMTEKLEHAFALSLDAPADVRMDPTEHLRFAWLPWAQALERATSHTNRVAIERVLSARQHAG